MQVNAPNVLSASPIDPSFSPMHKTPNGDGNGEACEASNDSGVNERKKQKCDLNTHMPQQNLTMLQQSCLAMMGPLQPLKLPCKKKQKKNFNA
jgi:hypothetical protein